MLNFFFQIKFLLFSQRFLVELANLFFGFSQYKSLKLNLFEFYFITNVPVSFARFSPTKEGSSINKFSGNKWKELKLQKFSVERSGVRRKKTENLKASSKLLCKLSSILRFSAVIDKSVA